MKSGNSRVDEFILAEHDALLGMSSKIGATVSSAVMKMQTEAGMYGNGIEIGVFEGRSLIPLAMSVADNELIYAVDPLNWPDDNVGYHLKENLRRFRVDSAVSIVTGKSNEPGTVSLLKANVKSGYRFIHIDGEHNHDQVQADLELALSLIEPRGVICLDDMLHPGYPDLYGSVEKVLNKAPGWQVFCVVDRESIVSSAKFLLCDSRVSDFYTARLERQFIDLIWPMGSQFRRHRATVITQTPILAKVRR